MNIQAALNAEHSKALTMRIVQYVGDDADRLAELMVCFFSDNWRLCQRGSWPVVFIAEKNPQLLAPYLERMILNLNNPVHNAVVRNTLRIMRELPTIPDDLLGLTADVCFRYVMSPSIAIAIRAFSMHVLAKICQKEPDLTAEVRILCEDWLQSETSAGIRSVAKEVLKKLK
jgi:hypothetical protein